MSKNYLRSPKHRVLELQSWMKKNKTATWQEFVKATGGTQTQFYHARVNLGIAKKIPNISIARKTAIAKTKQSSSATDTTLANFQKANEEYLSSLPKQEEIKIEGNTPDFIWYEMDLMQRKLGDLSNRLNHVMKVAQARDADQKKMMRDLIGENTELRVSNNGLRQQVSELTEMINGTSV